MTIKLTGDTEIELVKRKKTVWNKIVLIGKKNKIIQHRHRWEEPIMKSKVNKA